MASYKDSTSKNKIQKETKSKLTKKNKDVAIKFNLKPKVKNGKKERQTMYILRNIEARSRNHFAVEEH